MRRTLSTPPPTLLASRVAGDQLERDLLAAATDEERQPLLERRRVVADGLGGVARAGAPIGRSPWSMPRMTGSASPSQRSRSGEPDAEREAEGLVLFSNHAAPMPRIARPPEMWSSVVAIFAVRAGSRNVFAPTISPIRIRSVACAQAASVSQPSNIGPVESPDDRVQVVPRPERVVAEPVGPLPGLEQAGPVGVLVPAQGAELRISVMCDLPTVRG